MQGFLTSIFFVLYVDCHKKQSLRGVKRRSNPVKKVDKKFILKLINSFQCKDYFNINFPKEHNFLYCGLPRKTGIFLAMTCFYVITRSETTK